MPVLVGTASAIGPLGAHDIQIEPFFAALIAALLIQIGTNLANDVFDFRRGADVNRLGPTRVTQSGLLTPRQVLTATFLSFGLAAVIGLYLVVVGGWPILLIGIACILAGLAYTGGPWPIGYHALGDAFVFVFFGVVAVLGSAYLQTFTVLPLDVLASISVGCLVTAIIVVNNLRDIETDRAVGKTTLAVLIGAHATRMEYAILVVAAYMVLPVLYLAALLGSFFWLPGLTLIRAGQLVRTVRTSDGVALNAALKGTGQLHLQFGILFAATLLLPR